MEVCDVCCNFMANTDSEVRKSEHLAGKQHKGWEAIREHLNILKAMNDGKGPPRRKRDLDEMIGLSVCLSVCLREWESERGRERARGRGGEGAGRAGRAQLSS